MLQKQIEYLEEKKSKQQAELSNNIDIESLNRERQSLIDNGLKLKEKQANIEKDYNEKINEQKSLDKVLEDINIFREELIEKSKIKTKKH